MEDLAVKAQPSTTLKVQIVGGAPDPVCQKFYDMRGMDSNNLYTWNDARRGEFLLVGLSYVFCMYISFLLVLREAYREKFPA